MKTSLISLIAHIKSKASDNPGVKGAELSLDPATERDLGVLWITPTAINTTGPTSTAGYTVNLTMFSMVRRAGDELFNISNANQTMNDVLNGVDGDEWHTTDTFSWEPVSNGDGDRGLQVTLTIEPTAAVEWLQASEDCETQDLINE